MQAEAIKDERVRSASATVTLTSSGSFAATVTVVDAAGPFILVFAVSQAGVTLLGAP
jgi:hypothetical protein